MEEEITVVETTDEGSETVKATEPLISVVSDENESVGEVIADGNNGVEKAVTPIKTERRMTRKELFDELYKKYIDLPRKKWKRILAA